MYVWHQCTHGWWYIVTFQKDTHLTVDNEFNVDSRVQLTFQRLTLQTKISIDRDTHTQTSSFVIHTYMAIGDALHE